MVAWYECSPGQDTMEMLDGIRDQLGIRIQPGKDKSNINTSLPKGSPFRDNGFTQPSFTARTVLYSPSVLLKLASLDSRLSQVAKFLLK